MLALRPQSPLVLSDHYEDQSTSIMASGPATSTMSLAILPSAPMPTFSNSGSNAGMIPTLSAPSPSKKPRLTLDTSYLSTAFGKKATSLRLETLSATSPTSRNTFSNGHGDSSPTARHTLSPIATSPIRGPARRSKPALTPLRTIQRQDLSPITPERSASTDSVISSCSSSTVSSGIESVSSCSTLSSFYGEAPYKLALNIKSILSNGPIPRQDRSTSTSPLKRSASPLRRSRSSSPRSGKRVTFKFPLEEEVTNTLYTMRHSDLSDQPEIERQATVPTLSPPKKSTRSTRGLCLALDSTVPCSNGPEETEAGLLAQTADEAHDDRDTCPVTPVAGRNKKDREWVWTLGPLPGAQTAGMTASPEPASSSPSLDDERSSAAKAEAARRDSTRCSDFVPEGLSS